MNIIWHHDQLAYAEERIKDLIQSTQPVQFKGGNFFMSTGCFVGIPLLAKFKPDNNVGENGLVGAASREKSLKISLIHMPTTG